MSRTPKSASIQEIATLDLVTLDYVVPSSTVATAFLVITNLSAIIIDISVYINDGSSDFLISQNKIPSGIGKTWIVKELTTQKLNNSFTVKVQSTTADSFNAFLSVSEISNN